jgi:D-xylose reductase
MESLQLYDGDSLPSVGLGFWKIDHTTAPGVVIDAVRTGYRHLDCACDYGNEKEVGEGIQSAIKQGLCTRDDLWVTSKLWNTYHRREHVRPAIEKSLSDLRLDHLDLYLIHFPISQKFVPFDHRYPPEWIYDPDARNPRIEFDPVPIQETWEAMEEVKKAGLARHIGISNFNTALIRDLLSVATIRPSVLQVELHPFLIQKKLLRYCATEGIAVTGFSPLGAESYYSLGMADRGESLVKHPVIQEIASNHGKTPAQICLRWGVQRKTAVVPKSSSPQHLRENLQIFDFALTESQMDAIDSLNCNRRFNDPGDFAEKAFNTFCPIYD